MNEICYLYYAGKYYYGYACKEGSLSIYMKGRHFIYVRKYFGRFIALDP